MASTSSTKRAMFIKSDDQETVRDWSIELAALQPDLDIRVWPNVGQVEDIDFALVWDPKPGDLARYQNLKCIASLGAGVEHILKDKDLPPGVPVVRLAAQQLIRAMSEFVLLHVLRYHRQLPQFEAAQRQARWINLPAPDTVAARVGFLGLGELGRDAALKLRALGFDVAGWSRRLKQIEGIVSFAGADGLVRLLERSDYLICLLPLTADTKGIINRANLSLLPKGAFVINCGRGGHVVDEDLLSALDSGQIAGATLDVFHVEPLPSNHPYWRHPKVTVIPHASSITVARSGAPQMIENIRRIRAGKAPVNQVDLQIGY
jgi:glyoxylate/hydroxypyruvate reductase